MSASLSAAPATAAGLEFVEGMLPALGESAETNWAAAVTRATWGFVALGVAVRLLRYLMCFPLWGDEAFLAVNFPDRGYLELLEPLEYGQVCPLLFLWVELALVQLCGYCEWSLRLFPIVCGIAAVVLFRHVASRMLRGVPLLLAVAIFAVSYYPIRHASEVKPYASDLLIALGLIALAMEWARAPQQSRWLWFLALVTPVCLGLSYPAVFVAGGVSLALCLTVVRRREARTWIPYVLFNVLLAGSFLALFTLVARVQYESSVEAASTTTYWERSFPPLSNPWRLLVWFFATHTGRMFGYPIGGNFGASTATFVCFVTGALLLWRSSARQGLAILLAPFALTFVAAALQRYPYGGSGRVAQYLAPSICLLAGLGAAAWLTRSVNASTRRKGLVVTTASLALFGSGFLIADVVHPYKQLYDWQIREAWKTLWTEAAHEAELVCVSEDLQQPFAAAALVATGGTRAQYLCNQRIYAPRGWRPGQPHWDAVTPARPLRCVLFRVADETEFQPAASAWLAQMQTRLTLAGREQRDLDCSYRTRTKQPLVRFELFEFVPRPASRPLEQPDASRLSQRPDAVPAR